MDFHKVYAVGHRRVSMKVTESSGFVDKTFEPRHKAAHAAKLLVCGYHFAHCTHTPKEEAEFFLKHLGPLNSATDLAPVLDLEYQTGSTAKGKWATEWIRIVKSETGAHPVIYSYSSFLSACNFPKPVAPLWLAAYGRNDGKEYSYTIPGPWKKVAAHQYASRARVPGVQGDVDLTHVFDFGAFSLVPGNV